MKADIIQMAKEAGMEQDGDNFFSPGHEEIDVHISELTLFAQIVAKKCADIADTAEPYKSADLIRKHFGVEHDKR